VQAVAAIDQQLILAMVDGRSNVIAGQGLRDLPMLFENVDLSPSLHFADEMQPSGSQWQLQGSCWICRGRNFAKRCWPEAS